MATELALWNLFDFPMNQQISSREFSNLLSHATISDKTLCNLPLNANCVAERNKGNISLSYVEGHYIRKLLSFVFENRWNYKIIELTSRMPEPIMANNKDKVTYYVSSTAKIQLDITWEDGSETRYEDVGHGSGTSYSSIGDAFESAEKEAVTDALKRAAVNLGDSFGLVLYHKIRPLSRCRSFLPADALNAIKKLTAEDKELSIAVGKFLLRFLKKTDIQEATEPYELVVICEVYRFITKLKDNMVITNDTRKPLPIS